MAVYTSLAERGRGLPHAGPFASPPTRWPSEAPGAADRHRRRLRGVTLRVDVVAPGRREPGAKRATETHLCLGPDRAGRLPHTGSVAAGLHPEPQRERSESVCDFRPDDETERRDRRADPLRLLPGR